MARPWRRRGGIVTEISSGSDRRFRILELVLEERGGNETGSSCLGAGEAAIAARPLVTREDMSEICAHF
jgi:hypothetical protein